MAPLTSRPDAERDAGDVERALASLAVLLNRLPGTDAGGRPDPVFEDVRQVLIDLAEDAGAAAQRVVAYLRATRGPGDGDMVAVPPRLGPFRDWAPVSGHVLGTRRTPYRIGELPRPRRSDPGE